MIYLKTSVQGSPIPKDGDRKVLVLARDSGSPSLSSRRSYGVTYERSNRHTPTFDYDLNEVTVSEGLEPNSRVLSLVALDEDQGKDGEVR